MGGAARVGALDVGDGPDALHPVVEGVLKAVRGVVPDLQRTGGIAATHSEHPRRSRELHRSRVRHRGPPKGIGDEAEEPRTLTVPSSEPVRMMGSSGWKQTAETLCAWPSRVWMQVLVWKSHTWRTRGGTQGARQQQAGLRDEGRRRGRAARTPTLTSLSSAPVMRYGRSPARDERGGGGVKEGGQCSWSKGTAAALRGSEAAGAQGGSWGQGQLTSSVVVDGVDTLLVALQGVVGHRLPQAPDLDSPVERGTRKGVGVLGVEHHLQTEEKESGG